MKKVKFEGLFFDGFYEPPTTKPLTGILAANGLAVHSVIGESSAGKALKVWQITHLPSGYTVFLDYFKSRKLAIEAAKEISRDVDWGNLKTVKQATASPLARGARKKIQGRLKCSDYGIYTGWKLKGVTPAK